MKNKVVWITGATSGIGEALAYLFSTKGAKVVLSARRENELERVKANCTNPEAVLCLPLDLGDSSNFETLAQTVVDTFGRIDILVNNGGISQRSTVLETSEEVARRVMEINYFGNTALAKAVLKHMVAQKSGHLVPISSLTGKFGFFLRSSYAASKHALHGFYETLRLEEEKNNIHVTIICPGPIKTNISYSALDAKGNEMNKMDQGQEEGMPAEDCAKAIYKAIIKRKHEALVGGKELIGVYVKRFFPRLFFNLLKKQRHT